MTIARRRPRLAVLAAAAAAAVSLIACSGGGGSTPGPAAADTSRTSASGSTAPTAPGTSAPSTSVSPSAAARSGYYVSLGDSYAAGFQPTSADSGHTTRDGFAYQVVTKAAARGFSYTLVNFGCAGATSSSVLTRAGCARSNLGPGAPSYTATQADAAVSFLRAHRGKVALVTVSLGGNDITPCGARTDPTSCLTSALGTVKTNLTTLLTRVRAAAGPDVRIVGTTYPDVLLAGTLSSNQAAKNIASLSVFAFRSLINPTLQAAYTAAGGQFVDVTRATGAYGPSTSTTTLPPYGTIPVPVARLCQLTWACTYPDIHPRTTGYAIIADLVVGTLG